MLVVPPSFKGVTINTKMRLDHELFSSPETSILKWLGYSCSSASRDIITLWCYDVICQFKGDNIMSNLSKRSTVYFEPDIHQALKMRAASAHLSVSFTKNNSIRFYFL